MTHQISSVSLPLQTTITQWAGNESDSISQAVQRTVAALQRPSMFVATKPSRKPIPIEERLYDARARCKMKTAEVAMHLNPDWRTRFFYQLDSLMDSENWDEGDLPVTEASFTTLLRLLLLIKPKRRPGLGSTSGGHIIAAWTVGNDRLTIECMPDDTVRWVLSLQDHQTPETAAGQVKLPRLRSVLEPYAPQRWFADGR